MTRDDLEREAVRLRDEKGWGWQDIYAALRKYGLHEGDARRIVLGDEAWRRWITRKAS